MKNFVLLAMLSLTLVGCGGESKSVQEQVKSDMRAVSDKSADEYISELVESDSFRDGDILARKKLVESLLKKLQSDGLIKNFDINDDSTMFSYTDKGGILGGIKLDDWDPN